MRKETRLFLAVGDSACLGKSRVSRLRDFLSCTCVQDKKMIEERNPAFSRSWGSRLFGKKPGFSPSRFFVLHTGLFSGSRGKASHGRCPELMILAHPPQMSLFQRVFGWPRRSVPWQGPRPFPPRVAVSDPGFRRSGMNRWGILWMGQGRQTTVIPHPRPKSPSGCGPRPQARPSRRPPGLPPRRQSRHPPPQAPATSGWRPPASRGG